MNSEKNNGNLTNEGGGRKKHGKAEEKKPELGADRDNSKRTNAKRWGSKEDYRRGESYNRQGKKKKRGKKKKGREGKKKAEGEENETGKKKKEKKNQRKEEIIKEKGGG